VTARDEWRKLVAEACTGFRLDCIGNRPTKYQETMIHMLMAEIIRIHLMVAYAPIFAKLARMEAQLDILAKSGRDRWAPPKVRPKMPRMSVYELPEFLK